MHCMRILSAAQGHGSAYDSAALCLGWRTRRMRNKTHLNRLLRSHNFKPHIDNRAYCLLALSWCTSVEFRR